MIQRYGVRLASQSLPIIVAMVLAACSAGSTSAIPTPTATADLQKEYLSLVEPANAAAKQLAKVLSAPNVTGPEIRAAARPLIDALVKKNSGLLALEANVAVAIRQDIQALRQETSLEIVDLGAVVSSTTDAELNLALTDFDRHLQNLGSAAILVRSDLGLPPPQQ